MDRHVLGYVDSTSTREVPVRLQLVALQVLVLEVHPVGDFDLLASYFVYVKYILLSDVDTTASVYYQRRVGCVEDRGAHFICVDDRRREGTVVL